MEQTKLEPIYLLYDERMLLHRPVGWVEPEVFPDFLDEIDDDYPIENPERLRVIYERLCNLSKRLLNKDFVPALTDDNVIFRPLTCEKATKEQIMLAHSRQYFERMEQLEYYTDAELANFSEEVRHDIYYCQESFNAARLAAGGLLACVDAVCPSPDSPTTPRKTNKSLALVRPPGHHACQSQEMGFCFIDSVVVAAKYALAEKKAKRVCILDWDIHDGNGTSEATINDDNIFRIDIHRMNFYPYTGAPSEVGSGNARGLNLNLGWSKSGMGNKEYAAAFYELIIPLLADYKPDLLIISCGLDASMGDILGGCELTPGFFHAMTRATIEAVGPSTPVVCALEGGYTMSVIPDCMEAVTLAMLNCPYSYHSSDRFYCGGAAEEHEARTPWPSDPVERSRRTLSKYYVRCKGFSSMLLYSAIQDINTSIRIFRGLSRWKHVTLRRIASEPPKQNSNTSKKRSRDVLMDHPIQRPRIYMWYGTEWHHQRIW